MRPTRRTALLTAGLVTLLGLPATAAAAADPADLYVNSAKGSHCSDGGTGTKAVPFCSISAAAKVVKPGQTVWIAPDTAYPEKVTIDRSGEPGKPITFAAAEDQRNFRPSLAQGLTVAGASHVVIRKLQIGEGIQVVGSGDIELDQLFVGADEGLKGLVVGEGSTDVRVTRSELATVWVEGGARRTVLSRNQIYGVSIKTAVTLADAPETAVTNNTFVTSCEAALSVKGASTGSTVSNNVFVTWSREFRCTSPAPRTGILVAANAAPGVRADYNVITGPEVKMTPYTWAGTDYATPAAFKAGTGQGAHDILAPDYEAVGPKDGSPTIDSGDPTAPGVLPVDYYGKPVADDPRVPNTGKGGGYVDRGAFETQDDLSAVEPGVAPAWAPVGTKVKATAKPTSSWAAALTYRYDFGDGTPPVTTKATAAEHVYSAPCDCGVTVTAINAVGKEVSGNGSAKVTPAGPLTAAFTAEPNLPTNTSPLGGAKPLTMSFDTAVTAAPWPVTSMDVDFGDGETVHVDELYGTSHAYKSPGDYQVTLTLQDSKGAKSTVAKTVKARYAPSGYVASEPFRLLDTRTTNTPVQGGYPVPVQLPNSTAIRGHELSGGMASAVLNVTVTGATEDTHLSIWPSGQPRPATSNVNVVAGGTSSNTVTVPVGADGKIQAQLNSGKASVIVDFVGYYQPNIGERFSPLAPTRVLDTRTTGGALGGGKTRTVKVAGVNGIPADATAVALNLTSTGATQEAFVSAYPDPAKRPTTSNLNVEPGKDKSNQAIVPVGPNGTITLYTNTGSTHLILDAVGYYGKDGKALFTPVVPKRLADTRTTGKLAPGATTTVASIPSTAVGAVLNITATDTTAPGFLTAYASGGTLPAASSLNTLPGLTVPNHVTTQVGTGGKVSIFNSYGGSSHVITDLLGYFTTG
ncbi:PKD domain-containing protein [Streptomyces sp. NPDC058401]|uniref:PKD domain-containing protein n=1 Tax=Streptomyces sp. NPDC058401 TaxID=3346480 RepID=UPI003658F7BD